MTPLRSAPLTVTLVAALLIVAPATAATVAATPDGFRRATAAERKDMKRFTRDTPGVYGYYVSKSSTRFGVVCFEDDGVPAFIGLRRTSSKARFARYTPTSGGMQTYQLACERASH